MSEITSNALDGLRRATQSIAESADKISRGVDIGNPEPIVELKQAEVDYKANVEVLKVEKRLTDSILDILA